ncbi:hypothetical protein HDU93_006935, partial [Gonapodya sp. JEL0774]
VPVWIINHWILGGPSTIDQFTSRHMAIDELIREQVTTGRVSVVLELATGLSGRGLRLARKYPEITYLETDLADLLAHKRE